jgi:hypothetical protein
LRSLVFPQAEESRVSQFVFPRPFGEGDLGDELWFHPMDTTARQPIVLEQATRRLQFGKLPAQPTQRVIIERSSDLAGIYELSATVIA